VEPARFEWNAIEPKQLHVVVSSPTGQRIIELHIVQVSFPTFTTNTTSLLSDALDFGRLVPIVQPLLDGNTIPIPQEIESYSPLLQSAPMLKSYASVSGRSNLVRLTHIITNESFLPPIENMKVSKFGLALSEMEMTAREPEVVLDVIQQTAPRPKSALCLKISNWIDSISFKALE
jgi:hypothetical protein